MIFVNRYFHPDLSATSQILTDLAFHLAATGMEVTVVTGRRRYVDAKASLPRRERISGVDVIRVVTTGYGRARLPGRIADYLSFYLFAFITLVRILRSSDIVVAKTDPPLISVVTAVAARLRGARQVNWLQDLFPEVALVVEPGLLSKRVASLARRLRDWSLGRAEVNVVPGRIMSRKVSALGIAPERLRTIFNWTDDAAITPVPRDANPIRDEWGLQGKFVIAYSGNLGRAHEFRTILKAAQRLQGRSDLTFVLVGGGAQLPEVRRMGAEYGLSNVMEFPYQARERLPWSLSAGDLHLVSLLPELEGLVVPSKFYGIAAVQRPTAFVGDENGEIGALLKEHDCGRSFAIGDDRGLAEFILELAGNPQMCLRMGLNARRALDAEWSQAKAFEDWRALLQSLQSAHAPRITV